MRKTIAGLSAGLILLAAASSAAPCVAAAGDFELGSTIAFSSNRDNLNGVFAHPALPFEVYLMRPDGTNVRRLTHNTDGDGFAGLSPDGKKIVFDSNRNRPAPGTLVDADGNPCPVAAGGGPSNPDPSYFVSDLLLMNSDGSEQTPVRGRSSSATWSPESKTVAFHASASGAGCPSRSDPGAAATDSDIFVANVDELLAGTGQLRNITNTPDKVDDDADWSPAGRIVYTAHDVGDDVTNPVNPMGAASNSAELYLIDADGSDRLRLTDNSYEERAPSWSPNGEKIVYSCRIDGGFTDFEICVIDADKNPDGTLATPTVLTANSVADLTASFSPDGERIVFQRPAPGQGNQLFTMAPGLNADATLPTATQLTFPPGMNGGANWGELRAKAQDSVR
jgi:Tol biopolymer transport system component